MLLDFEEDIDKNVKISYFNSEGKTEIEKFDGSNALNFIEYDKTNQKSKKSVHPKYTSHEGKEVVGYIGKKIDKFAQTRFIANLPQTKQDLIFANNFPNVFFFDIEVEVGDEFPDPEYAKTPITTIAVVFPDKKGLILGLKNLSDQDGINKQCDEHFNEEGWDVKYKQCTSEVDLIKNFLKIVSRTPILSGWNCIDFDWQFIINRCKKLGIDYSISSPNGRMKDTKIPIPYHVGIIDYMELYRKWDRIISIKENFQLDTASYQVLGKQKIKYDGSLQQLYENDFSKYCFYNIVDTILVDKIHKKLRTMDIMLRISNLCKVGLYKANSPVSVTESLISQLLLKDDKVITGKRDESKKDSKYEGAFVKKPITGRHFMVASFDFSSLYPTIIRQFNISPDTFVSKTDDEDKIKKLQNKDNDKYIPTSSGAIYKQKRGWIPQILDDLYDQRKYFKKKSFNYQLCVDEIKNKLKEV